MRYVVRIAGTQRAIESSNAHCARRQPGGPARPSAASDRPSPLAGGVGARGGPDGPPRGAQMHLACGARARPRPAAPPRGPRAHPNPPPGTHAGRSIRLRRDRPARRPRGGRRQRSRGAARTRALKRRPRIGQGYPPNLSISVSGGKETNRDCPSSGERSGNSPDLKSGPPPRGGGPSCSLEREPPAPRAPGPSRRAGRVPWNGAPQRVRAPCGRAPRVRTAAGGRVPRRVG